MLARTEINPFDDQTARAYEKDPHVSFGREEAIESAPRAWVWRACLAAARVRSRNATSLSQPLSRPATKLLHGLFRAKLVQSLLRALPI